VPVADLKRLGRRGAYRLGRLRAQGVGEPGAPTPFRPSFARPAHRGPRSAWIFGFLAGTALIAAGAVGGVWFMPFVIGVLAGIAMRWGGWRPLATLTAVTLMGVTGWSIPLWWAALHGQPTGATARVIAALAGLPARAGVGIAAALLVAVLQALAGAWLGRTLAPRRAGS
jgi:hypothetical protein